MVTVTTVVSEKWMERFVINLDVLCSDGLASGDDRAGESSDVGSDVLRSSGSDTDSGRPGSVRLFPGRVRWPGHSGRPCLRSIPLLFLLGGGCRCIPPGYSRVRYSASVWPTVG